MSAVMQREVLVLNKGWTAIMTVPLERALTMLFSSHQDNTPKARIIDPTRDFAMYTWEDWSSLKPKGGEDVIRSADKAFRVPEVIRLSKYDRVFHEVRFNRRTLYRRDDNQCQYCGGRPGTEFLNVDHVVPRSQGGRTTWDNCCIACVTCNTKKANRTPAEAGMKFFHKNYKPGKPKSFIFKGKNKPKSWEAFISNAYWAVELQNDNP